MIAFRRGFAVWITEIFAISACVVPAAADKVTLRNGDRITGEIVKQDGKTLTLKSEFLGVVNIPWKEVRTVDAEKPLHVGLENGRTLRATLTTKEEEVEIAAEDQQEKASLADIIFLRSDAEQRTYERLLSPAWTQLWAGSVTLGYAGTAGNAETQTLTAAFNAARVTRADKASVHLNAIRASALIQGLSEPTANAIRGGIGYSRNTSPRFFVNAFNDYEYDRFQNVDLRFVLGGGGGIIAWRGERGRLDFLAGGAYNRESLAATEDQPDFVRHAGEAYFGNEFTFKLNSVTSVFQNMRFFPNISDTGEYRLNVDAGANTRLFRWLSWNFAISNRVLSNPVGGRERSDLIYTTGLGITFAQ